MSKFLHAATDNDNNDNAKAKVILRVFSENNQAENGRKFSKRIENTGGKGEIAHFKRPVLQTRTNKGLLGKGFRDWYFIGNITNVTNEI